MGEAYREGRRRRAVLARRRGQEGGCGAEQSSAAQRSTLIPTLTLPRRAYPNPAQARLPYPWPGAPARDP